MSAHSALHESLQALYDYLGHLRLSLELVRKLAKHLKLDTYVDYEILTASDAKRLSIAGTNLLVDIDFMGDAKVSALTLSVGSLGALPQELPLDDLPISDVNGSQFITSSSTIDGVTRLCLDFSLATTPSFLGTAKCLEAEKILLQSLQGDYLGTFPQNLYLLAQLDQELFGNGSIATDLDKIAWILEAVHSQECALQSEDDNVAQGWTSRFGKVKRNNYDQNAIGIFLQFWKARRGLELAGAAGKTYNALLSFENLSAPPKEYLMSARDELWQLCDASGASHSYKLDFDPLSLALLSSHTRVLVLRPDEPIYIPKQILEYLDVHHVVSRHVRLREVYKALEDPGSVSFKTDEPLPDVTFSYDEASPFVPVESFKLDSLNELTKLVPVLRNFLFLGQMLESVHAASEYTLYASNDPFLAEASNKIRDRLKLSSEVPNEELAGLNAFSADYLNAPILESSASLQSFVKDESPRESEMGKADSAASELTPGYVLKPSLIVSVVDVWYDSPNLDLVVSVRGKVSPSVIVSKEGRISNGEFIIDEIKSEDAMEVDDTEKTNEQGRKFCKALALTNNILLSLKSLL